MKRFAILSIIIAFAVMAAACSKTTFDRIGGVIVAAAEGYQRQMDNLFAEKLISQETYDKRKASAAAALLDAKDYQALLAKYPVINKTNISQIAGATSDLARKFRATLTNSDLGNLPPGSGPVKALSYAITVLDNASIALAALFPPSPDPTPANATLSPSKQVPAKSIKVNLPPRP